MKQLPQKLLQEKKTRTRALVGMPVKGQMNTCQCWCYLKLRLEIHWDFAVKFIDNKSLLKNKIEDERHIVI